LTCGEDGKDEKKLCLKEYEMDFVYMARYIKEGSSILYYNSQKLIPKQKKRKRKRTRRNI
jgi:hypothetical protein